MEPDNAYDILAGKIEVMSDAMIADPDSVSSDKVAELREEVETAYRDESITTAAYYSLSQMMEDAGLVE